MNNIRKIINERFKNARNDLHNTVGRGLQGELKGQIEAYQDCLNLMQPRTEQEILNDFEKLGYRIEHNKDNTAILLFKTDETKVFETCIYIDLKNKEYRKQEFVNTSDITMQEHKLLNELFEVIFDDK
jgi:hypothetical protein